MLQQPRPSLPSSLLYTLTPPPLSPFFLPPSSTSVGQPSCNVFLLFISLCKFCKFCQFSATKQRNTKPQSSPPLLSTLQATHSTSLLSLLPSLPCCHWLQVSALLSFLLNTMEIAGPRLLFATPLCLLRLLYHHHHAHMAGYPCSVDASAVTFSLHFVSLPLRWQSSLSCLLFALLRIRRVRQRFYSSLSLCFSLLSLSLVACCRRNVFISPGLMDSDKKAAPSASNCIEAHCDFVRTQKQRNCLRGVERGT